MVWIRLYYITTHRYGLFYNLARSGLTNEFVVGQGEQIQALANHIIASPQGSVAVVVGPFGSGKTEFIYGLTNELTASGRMKLEEIHRVAINDIYWEDVNSIPSLLRRGVPGQIRSSFATEPVDIISTPPRLVIIEEGERADKETHETAFIISGLLLPQIPFLIFTGGSTLKDKLFFELLGVDQDKVYQVNMDPVTPNALKEAMKKRMTFLFGDQVEEFNPDALFDPGFLDFLLPKTNPSIATYREVFNIILKLGNNATDWRLSSQSSEDFPALIDGDLYRRFHEFKSPYHNLRPNLAVVVSRIQELIRNTYDSASYFQPLTYRQLVDLGLYEGLDAEGSEREERRSERLTSLILDSIVEEVCVPKITRKKIQERTYLPTIETFLNARYLPLNV